LIDDQFMEAFLSQKPSPEQIVAMKTFVKKGGIPSPDYY